MLRMKVQTMRTLLWAGNVVLILATLGFFAKIYLAKNEKGPGKLFAHLDTKKIEAAANVAPRNVDDGGEGAQHWRLYQSTHTLNVTGKEPPKVDVPDEKEKEDVPELKPIEDVLRVDLLFYVGPDGSRAKVRYLEDGPLGVKPTEANPARAVLGGGSRPREEARLIEPFLAEGDELREPWNAAPFHGTVKEITADGVVFSWGGDDVVLHPGEMARADRPAKTMPGLDEPTLTEEELARRMEEARETRKVGEHGWFIGTDELDRLEQEHDEILAGVGVGMTYSRSEKRPLLQLNTVPEESLVAERGFEEGDVLLSINGEAVSSKYAAIQYFRQNPSVTKFNVEIERRGTRITKVFETAR